MTVRRRLYLPGSVVFVIAWLALCVTGCQSNYTLKNPYLPTQITIDSIGPKYLHNTSQIKFWDRISTADHATGFAWWDSAGVVHELNEYYDKVVVLNFFGTWSRPAIEQLQELKALRASLDTNVLFVGVTQKEGVTGGAAVLHVDSFATAQHVPYQLLIGSRDFGFCYGGIDVVPTTFVITRRRKINSTFEGFVSRADLLEAVEKARKKP